MKATRKPDINFDALHRKQYLYVASSFSVLCIFFLAFLNDHILSFQKEQFLFIFSGEYLKERALMPGGLLEYAGRFLSQFYEVPLAGSLILVLILILSGYLTFKVSKPGKGRSFAFISSLIVPVLLLLMHQQYFHMLEYTLSFVLVLSFILLFTRITSAAIILMIFPFMWYFAGVYALAVPVSYLLFAAVSKDRRKMIMAAALFIVAAITFLLFRNALFLVSGKQLLTYPLPLIANTFHKIFFVLLAAFIITLPAFTYISDKKLKILQKKHTMVISSSLVFITAGFLIIRVSNPMISDVLKIQDAAYTGNWDKVIEIHEKHHSGNLVGEYFYNVALSEKGLLCDKMFSGSHTFGTSALILPWGNEHLERGAYFFYTAGLVNEAFRWAYEEMVVYGLRPHNIRMLIKTSLLSGNYQVADKYINILSNTLFYRKEAEEYKKLSANPETISSHPELGQISRIIPQKDFFIYTDKPEENLPALFDSNNANRRAFEYMTGWLLFEKNIETALSNIRFMPGMGYKRLPRCVEEAVLIYYNSQGKLPDLSGYSISTETMNRFNQYTNAFQLARNNPETAGEMMKKRFGDTYWYYVHFGK